MGIILLVALCVLGGILLFAVTWFVHDPPAWKEAVEAAAAGTATRPPGVPPRPQRG